MRSPMILYIAAIVGVLLLAFGFIWLSLGHHLSAYASIILGAILLVAGITALIVARRGGSAPPA